VAQTVVLVLKTSRCAPWVVPQVEALLTRGHRVVAVLPAGDGPVRRALGERGVPVVDSATDFGLRPRPSTAAGLVRFRRQLRALGPDVLLYHLYASALATRLASAGWRVPRVHMVAGPLYLDSPLVRAAERLLARLDTVTIGGSAFTARRYHELGRPARAIPYGVDTTWYRPGTDSEARQQTRAELGVAPGELLVVMVAYVYAPKRLVHRGRGIKGHAELLTAWRRFAQRHPGSRLLLVGGGFDEAGERYRRRLVERYRPERHGVTWLDSVADVRPYYAAADLSVSPSLSDNHGAALEAGAMGLPSIVTDAAALPETVDAGCGWIVPAGDSAALARALADAHREYRLGGLPARGALARTRVCTRFDATTAAESVADVVESAARDREAVRWSRRGGECPSEVGASRSGDGGFAARGAGSPAGVGGDGPRSEVRGSAGRGSSLPGDATPAGDREPSAPGSSSPSRVVTILTEARLGRDATGAWAAEEPALGAAAWARYLADGGRLRLVARAAPRPGSAAHPLPPGVRVVPLPYYVGAIGLVRALPRLLPAVCRAVLTAEVLVLRLPGAVGLLGALVATVTRRRYAAEVVGDPEQVLVAGVLGATGRRVAGMARGAMRRAVHRAAAVQYVTERALQRRYPSAPGVPTATVPNVRLPAQAFRAQSRVWRPGPALVVTVGSQEQHYKGHDVLLRALRRLADQGLDVRGVFVGGGRRHDELVALADTLGLADRVRFTGPVHDRDRLVELLDRATVFALPSRTEGLPRALVEAMARALPAVGSAVGGVPELLDPRFLVPPDDDRALAHAVRVLLDDPALWTEQSARNLRAAGRFELGRLDGRFAEWLLEIPGVRP
jgi:glycosyltransferase involved in cell wall biosynthesis